MLSGSRCGRGYMPANTSLPRAAMTPKHATAPPGNGSAAPNTSLQRTACSGRKCGSFSRFVLSSCVYCLLWAAAEFSRWASTLARRRLHMRTLSSCGILIWKFPCNVLSGKFQLKIVMPI